MKPIIQEFAIVGFFFLVLIAGFTSTAAAREKPNVVMIIYDDQAWTDYSFMSHDTIKTPQLDALAKRSVLFRRRYVPTALCRPPLMTMITGHYAHRHVTGNDPSPKYAERFGVWSSSHILDRVRHQCGGLFYE